MMKKQLKLINLVLSLVVYIGATTAPAWAATAPAPTAAQSAAANAAKNGQALEIAPPVVTLAVNPGQTVKTTIYLRNISGSSLIVTGQANDFVAGDENGTPKLLLKDDASNPYSLKAWIAQVPSLTLVPKEIKTLSVTISVPANASPGGHYGVIRFTGTPAELSGTGVSLSASLGALILLTVNGKTNESMSVQQFYVTHDGSTGSLFESGPVNFAVRLKNSGNVHEQPVGRIAITDMFGKAVASVNVNLPPRNVLPQSIRKFETPLDKSVLGTKKLFGHYNATLKVTYGADKKVITSKLSFWIIPYRLIGLLIIILVAGFFGLRRLLGWYNRRIIERSRNSRR